MVHNTNFLDLHVRSMRIDKDAQDKLSSHGIQKMGQLVDSGRLMLPEDLFKPMYFRDYVKVKAMRLAFSRGYRMTGEVLPMPADQFMRTSVTESPASEQGEAVTPVPASSQQSTKTSQRQSSKGRAPKAKKTGEQGDLQLRDAEVAQDVAPEGVQEAAPQAASEPASQPATASAPPSVSGPTRSKRSKSRKADPAVEAVSAAEPPAQQAADHQVDLDAPPATGKRSRRTASKTAAAETREQSAQSEQSSRKSRAAKVSNKSSVVQAPVPDATAVSSAPAPDAAAVSSVPALAASTTKKRGRKPEMSANPAPDGSHEIPVASVMPEADAGQGGSDKSSRGRRRKASAPVVETSQAAQTVSKSGSRRSRNAAAVPAGHSASSSSSRRSRRAASVQQETLSDQTETGSAPSDVPAADTTVAEPAKPRRNRSQAKQTDSTSSTGRPDSADAAPAQNSKEAKSAKRKAGSVDVSVVPESASVSKRVTKTAKTGKPAPAAKAAAAGRGTRRKAVGEPLAGKSGSRSAGRGAKRKNAI